MRNDWSTIAGAIALCVGKGAAITAAGAGRARALARRGATDCDGVAAGASTIAGMGAGSTPAMGVTGAGASGARQTPSTRTVPAGQASTGAARRSSIACTATAVSGIVEDPARSPIACDANAAPEKAPAIFGLVQLPEVSATFGTALTGEGALTVAVGQNTPCACADPVNAGAATPNANITANAPRPLIRNAIVMAPSGRYRIQTLPWRPNVACALSATFRAKRPAWKSAG